MENQTDRQFFEFLRIRSFKVWAFYVTFFCFLILLYLKLIDQQTFKDLFLYTASITVGFRTCDKAIKQTSEIFLNKKKNQE